MNRGFKQQVKRVEVQPVRANVTALDAPRDESNSNAAQTKKDKFYSIKVKSNIEKDPFGIPESATNTKVLADENTSRLQKIAAVFKTKELTKADVVKAEEKSKENLKATVDEIATAAPNDTGTDSDQAADGTKSKKKAKKKKKRRYKNRVHALNVPDESEPQPKALPDAQRESTPAEDLPKQAEIVQPTGCCAKLPLFGFIATWNARRKERRRERKRKAIAARQASQVQPLVEYEHKRSKGGMAFTVEVDDRPMRKAVLPPIKQRPGGVMNDIEEKFQKAERQREMELNKKKKSSKEHDKKQAECQERKADSEQHYRKKVDLTIRNKQSIAEQNRNRIKRDPGILRAPSTLPPLRVARVKPAPGTDNDPDDGLFDF